MKHVLSPFGGVSRPLPVWSGLLAMAASFLFGSSVALAAPAPANTVIGNQASASYQDANGNAQVTTSNIVQTTVQQVGSFTLDGKLTTNSPLDVVNTKAGGGKLRRRIAGARVRAYAGGKLRR